VTTGFGAAITSYTRQGQSYVIISSTSASSIVLPSTNAVTGVVFLYEFNSSSYSLTLVSVFFPGNAPANVSKSTGSWNFGTAIIADDNKIGISAIGDPTDYTVSALYLWDYTCNPLTTICFIPGATTDLFDPTQSGCAQTSTCCTVSTYYTSAYGSNFCQPTGNVTQSCPLQTCVTATPVPAPGSFSLPTPGKIIAPGPETVPSGNGNAPGTPIAPGVATVPGGTTPGGTIPGGTIPGGTTPGTPIAPGVAIVPSGIAPVSITPAPISYYPSTSSIMSLSLLLVVLSCFLLVL